MSAGLHRAGFDVVDVDILPRKRYPFPFVQADALRPPFDLRRFDFIWASPPCQAHTALNQMHNAKEHEDLIPPTRALLVAAGVPWCMENVPGAPLKTGLRLCGSMFGLGTNDAELRRHRLFELSWQMPIFGLPQCSHGQKPRVIGLYGGHGRDRRRTVNTQDFSTDDCARAMGIDWMTGAELSQAIPPAYSEFIGLEAMKIIQPELQQAAE